MDLPEVVRPLVETEEMVIEAEAELEELINREDRLQPGALATAVDDRSWACRERARLREMLN